MSSSFSRRGTFIFRDTVGQWLIDYPDVFFFNRIHLPFSIKIKLKGRVNEKQRTLVSEKLNMNQSCFQHFLSLIKVK